jgi:toxin ParE1/3/4
MTRLVARYQNFGRERSDIATKVRGVVSCSYAILYRILGDEVELVRYVHVRRQLKGLL